APSGGCNLKPRIWMRSRNVAGMTSASWSSPLTTTVSTGWSVNWCARSASASTVREDDAMADRRNAWTIEDVAVRFEEAASTARRLPPVRVQGYFNCWPAIKRMSWENLGAEPTVYRFPPDPAAIERMLEVMRWVQWLEEEHRHLV